MNETNTAVAAVADGKSGKLPDGAALLASYLDEESSGKAPGGEEGLLEGSEKAGGETAPGEEAAKPEAAVEADTAAGETNETGETEETADGNAEDAEGEEIRGLDPKIQGKLNRRVAREVGKRKEVEGKLAAMEAEVERLKAGKPEAAAAEATPMEVDPVLRHPNVAAHREAEGKANALRSVAEGLLGRLENEDEAGVLAELRAAKVYARDGADAKRVLEGIREDAIRKGDRAGLMREVAEETVRGEFATRRVEFDRAAEVSYPWLKDVKSAEAGMFQRLMGDAPWLKHYPGGKLIVADAVAGAVARMAKAQAAGRSGRDGTTNEKPPGKVPPKLGGAPGAAPAGGKGNPKEAFRSQVFKDPGNKEARTGYMAAVLAEAGS